MDTKQDKPTILAQTVSEHNVSLVLQIDPEISYFEGHFPSFALLAGVVQIDWAIYYAEQFLSCSGKFAGMEVIKFQQPILPDSKVLLTLTWIEDKQKLHFAYHSEDQQVTHSSGRIKLDIS